jgi:aldehyde dehydrogenase (NAD+)
MDAAAAEIWHRLGLKGTLAIQIGGSSCAGTGEERVVRSPIDGRSLAAVRLAGREQVAAVVQVSAEAFRAWRVVPAPRRGELVRRYGQLLRAHQEDLARLVVLEAGKIVAEARGEVQEMIDICDFAVGLSRQLYGLTMASERPAHRLTEQWHPLGPVAVISAFNFPVAVWAWNAALALVCGDPVIWKPSEKTPLTALACHALLQRVVAEFDEAPEALSCVVVGDREAGRPWCRRPVRRGWAARWRGKSPGGWAVRCWNSAATTP